MAPFVRKSDYGTKFANMCFLFKKGAVKMFKVNDVITYGSNGICKIEGIEEKNLTGTTKNYFVLKPLDGDNSTCFVPVDNESLLGKMRKVLSKEDIKKLIDSIPHEEALWIEDERKRKECYKKIITDGNHSHIIKIVKALYMQKKEREENGKKLHIADEYFLKDAQKRLCDEFRYVLNLSEEDTLSYILKKIEK